MLRLKAPQKKRLAFLLLLWWHRKQPSATRSRTRTYSQIHLDLVFRTRRIVWFRTTQFTVFPYNSPKLPVPMNRFVGLFLSCSDIQKPKSKMLPIKSCYFSYKRLMASLLWMLPLKESGLYFPLLGKKRGIKGKSWGPHSVCHPYASDWKTLL